MSDATDADRQRAVEVLGYSQLTYDEMIFADSEPHERALADTIAAALADEREKARAPFLLLAQEYEHERSSSVAARIRRAAGVGEQ